MVSQLGHLFVGWLTVGAAHAQEGQESAGLQDMLDSIPAIEAPKPDVEDKPSVAQPLDYQTYTRSCHDAVMLHFKPPRSVVKKQPDIELELLLSVDLEGRVQGAAFGRRSGVSAFDRAALKAVNKAGDLPAPPAGWNVDKDRVILTFGAR